MTPVDLQAVEEEIDAFLERHAPRSTEEDAWGVGPDVVHAFEEQPPELVAQELHRTRQWRRALAAADLHWLAGPPELGGRGMPVQAEHYLHRRSLDYEGTDQRVLAVGLEIVGPVIEQFGSADARKNYCHAIRTGDVVACQLFSEPSHGSDLAGVQTRAVRADGGWRITGQKVWTSGAQLSDIGEILVRTDPDQGRHRGLTMFVVDLHQPGVEVRPIRTMTGGRSFNEVFLTDAWVGDADRLGDERDGWTVARGTLERERAAMGAGRTSGIAALPRLRQLVEKRGALADPFVCQQMAEIEARSLGLAVLAQRQRYERSVQGDAVSMNKLHLTALLQRIASLVVYLLGDQLIMDDGEWGTFGWTTFINGVPGMRLAGGTDEILRNVLAERVLGLPREPK